MHTQVIIHAADTNVGWERVKDETRRCESSREKRENEAGEDPVIVSTVQYLLCDSSGKGERERESGESPPADNEPMSLSEGEGTGRRGRAYYRSARSIERAEPLDRANLVFAEGRALCLRVVTLAGVRAARCQRIIRFPVFLSGGAWCRLQFLSDIKLVSLSLPLLSLSFLSLSPLCSRRLLTSLPSFALSLCSPCTFASYILVSFALI